MTIKAFKIPSLFEVRFIESAGGCEKPHTHPSLIISAVSKGGVSLQINDTETCLRREMLAAVGPNVLHCIRSYSPNFDGVYVLEVFGFPADCEGFEESHFQLFGSRLFQEKNNYDVFVALCRTLLKPTVVSEKVKAYVDWVHCFFITRFSGYPFQIQQNHEPSPLAGKIRKILDDNYQETLPYADIAKVCGYSNEHCNRVFKQSYNLSMQTYFLNKKAARARGMLNSGESLSEIALICGFYDQSHFTRVFKGIYQVSPKKYREAVYGTCHSHTRKSSAKHI